MSGVNSAGMTNFVDGLAPSALSASRYWSAIVFSSTPRRRLEDLRQRLAEALGPQDRRLALALGLEDLGLLLALGDVDRRLPVALGLGDDRAPRPLGGELPVHRVLDVARRRDLADLDRRDLAAPALGDLVELDPQDLVDLLALATGPRRGGCRR